MKIIKFILISIVLYLLAIIFLSSVLAFILFPFIWIFLGLFYSFLISLVGFVGFIVTVFLLGNILVKNDNIVK